MFDRYQGIVLKLSPQSLGFTFLLAALAAFPPLSTDLYLSVLSVIGQSLGTSPEAAGYTVSVFLGSFALSQLVFGPLSDRYGRRPIGLLGCALYSVTAFGCARSSSLSELLVWRCLSGMGAGAASVLAFAIVRDLFSGVAGRVRFAYVSATQALAPMFAPVLGSLLYRFTGWRSLFILLGAAGVLVTAAFGLCFEESLPQERRATLALRDMLSNYRHILVNRQAVACCLLNALSMGSLLAYITGSSFVFVDLLGAPRTEYGGILLLTASGAMIGSWMSGRLNRAFVAPNNILIAGLTLVFTAAGTMLLLSLWGRFTTMTAVPLSLAMTISIGLVTPNVANSMLAPLAKMAGAASALFGCVGMLGGAFSSAVIASIPSKSAVPLTVVMTMCSALALTTFFVLYRPRRLEEA